MMFGVAEDHDSNPIKAGLAQLKERGAKFISVNPVRTGYSAIADEWLGITPGSDGLFVLSLVHELLRAGRVDGPYLARYTNAPYLVVDAPGTAADGLFARDEDGRPLCWDRRADKSAPAGEAGLDPAMRGTYELSDGRRVKPVFHLLAERYLDAQYGPDVASFQTGIPAATIRRIAAELAHAAFELEVVIEQPWTDWTGRRHERMVGRPVSLHAMRGISAHSNGFQTCRALHLLQILLGSIDAPGGLRYKPPYPKGLDSLPKPTGHPWDIAPNTPLAGPHLGFVQGPEDLLVDDDGNARRIDKAFSWEAPLAAHGMMHTVIANAWRGDPYPIDLLFMYMANMAWNSSMNTEECMRMLSDKDEATGAYKIPRIIYADAYYSEMVAYADLVLPDTTYLERWDCISLLDRPISEPDGAADAIRQPVVEPDRDVRPFQDVLIDLGSKLGFPGLIREGGRPRYPGGYADFMVNHERQPGLGLLAGWRGQDGTDNGRGEVNPDQLKRYVDNQCFWHEELADEQKYFRNVNAAYLTHARQMGFVKSSDPIIAQLYLEPMQRFRLAAEGHGPVQPPDIHRQRIKTYFDPLPFWYEPFDQPAQLGGEYPLHAITQRPMAMYHSWGSQNAWLRQIHGANRLYIPRALGERLSLEDGDWVHARSRSGQITARVRLMDGLNAKTVWTWNAIGKRAGAWNLDHDADEVLDGFLLNHLIDDFLPEDASGFRHTRSDPLTGQAAWYDLRVSITKAPPGTIGTEPSFEPLGQPAGMADRPGILRYGAGFRKTPGGSR